MTNAEVTRLNIPRKPENYIEDPIIVKVAKLALILADKNIAIDERMLCVKAAERFCYITEEEAKQLLLYRKELELFMER